MRNEWLGAAIGLLALAWLAARWSGEQRSRRDGEVERLHDLVWRTSESEERYRSLVEAQIELVVQRDAEGRITFASAGFAALLGTVPAALLGTTREVEVVESGRCAGGPTELAWSISRSDRSEAIPRAGSPSSRP